MKSRIDIPGRTVLGDSTAPEKRSPFFSPSSVRLLAAPEWNALFIADRIGNRIYIVDMDTGAVLMSIGSGIRGRCDGTFESASFDAPMGMVISGNTLILADSGNNAVRTLDLANRTVGTLLSARSSRIPGFWIPTDVAEVSGILYVTTLGTGILWEIDPYYSLLHPFELPTGPRFRPIGLARLNDRLYMTDPVRGTIFSVPVPGKSEAVRSLPIRRRTNGSHSGTIGIPTGMAAFHDSLLLCGSDSVLRIDASTGIEEDEFLKTPDDLQPTGSGRPDFFSVSASESHFFTAGMHTNGILRVDPGTGCFSRFPLSFAEAPGR